MQDAIIEPLLRAGRAGRVDDAAGRPASTSLLYCVAPPDPTGERVANYTRPIDAGAATLIFGNATLGKNGRGEPIVHCHATFVCADGSVRGGHIVVDRSVVGARAHSRCWPRRWTASSCASRRTRKPTCR